MNGLSYILVVDLFLFAGYSWFWLIGCFLLMIDLELVIWNSQTTYI